MKSLTKKITNGILAVSSVAAFSAPVCAATISYFQTFGSTPTNFSTQLSFGSFDTQLGSLLSVSLLLNAVSDATLNFESLDSSSSRVVGINSALVDILLNGRQGTLFSAYPISVQTKAAGAFDVIIDFSGNSGGIFSSQANTTTTYLVSAADFNYFTSAQPITFAVNASGISSTSGAGNLISQISQKVGGDLTLTYNFAPGQTTYNVPEPGSLALLGLGLIGFITSRYESAKRRNA